MTMRELKGYFSDFESLLKIQSNSDILNARLTLPPVSLSFIGRNNHLDIVMLELVYLVNARWLTEKALLSSSQRVDKTVSLHKLRSTCRWSRKLRSTANNKVTNRRSTGMCWQAWLAKCTVSESVKDDHCVNEHLEVLHEKVEVFSTKKSGTARKTEVSQTSERMLIRNSFCYFLCDWQLVCVHWYFTHG